MIKLHNNDLIRLFKKYVWILIIYYVVAIGIPKVSSNFFWMFTDNFGWTVATTGTLLMIIKIFVFFYNIGITLIMYMDYKKYDIGYKWTALLSLIYIPIGVTVFFINMILNRTKD